MAKRRSKKGKGKNKKPARTTNNYNLRSSRKWGRVSKDALFRVPLIRPESRLDKTQAKSGLQGNFLSPPAVKTTRYNAPKKPEAKNVPSTSKDLDFYEEPPAYCSKLDKPFQDEVQKIQLQLKENEIKIMNLRKERNETLKDLLIHLTDYYLETSRKGCYQFFK